MMQHLACVMDGNRRWAKQHGLSRIGSEGADAAYRAVEWCIAKKIPHLSLFAFSLENYNRGFAENGPLFMLMAAEMLRRLDDLKEHEIRVRFIGDHAKFPSEVRDICTRLERETAEGRSISVYIFFCYGGRQEIVDATRRIAQAAVVGTLKVEDINASLFATYLWGAGIPDPDLIIRSGKVKRMSNFMLYQAAYAELFFIDILWPDITDKILDEALAYYNSCKRNFGL